ncbi:ATP-binding cassette domain-containing protein [Slackia sp.]|uniref:ATP-binding cassette domain-containing protein n=1 Tax=Slackia sp. TaxID=2049041 RepID=UPI0026293B59|nr:ATP-binding cassette domain-containing protein [Slackia sp.]
MPENVNVSALASKGFEQDDFSLESMVKVDHVSMVFNMASEQLNSLKEYAIALAKRELRFKEFRALDDISLDIKKGDVFGILGTNGSGKSTLLKIIAGVLEPTEGSCSINGNIAPLIELGAGFDMELTARENIYLNGALLGYSKRFIDDHFDEIVDFAEVERFLDMPMKNYSSGMVARIAFAIATVIVPDILIVDEVLSVGDFMFQKKCEDRITKLIKEHQVTVLIVSHNNDQIERLCNKAAWIEKGHLRMVGDAAEVCRTYRVLGGHTGSAESEKRVFETLTSSVKVDKSRYRDLPSDTPYDAAVKAASLCHPDGVGCVVLASGERDMDALISTGLAGAYGAPVLLVRNDGLPDVTEHELKRLNPKKVIIVGSEEVEIGKLEAQVRSSLGAAVTLECIYGETSQKLSFKIFEYGLSDNIWGSSIVMTFVGCVGDLASLSPFVREKRCPVLLKRIEDPMEECMYSFTKKGSFNRVIVLGGMRSFPESYCAPFEELGCEVVRFVHPDGIYTIAGMICDWVRSELFPNERLCDLVIAPLREMPHLFTLSEYMVLKNSVLLLNDPQDLDGVANAICYIAERSDSIQSLIFVGSRRAYNELDKTLLVKSLNG